MTTRIAFLGTGLMGAPMALRLLSAGFAVTVWNRSPEKTAPATQSLVFERFSSIGLDPARNCVGLAVERYHGECLGEKARPERGGIASG
jgi:prephenate dehydrogenase